MFPKLLSAPLPVGVELLPLLVLVLCTVGIAENVGIITAVVLVPAPPAGLEDVLGDETDVVEGEEAGEEADV